MRVRLSPRADAASIELLEMLLAEAETEFLDYTGQSAVPASAEQLIVKMACIAYDRRGTESNGGQSFSGVSDSYIDGYPAAIVKQLQRYRRCKAI